MTRWIDLVVHGGFTPFGGAGVVLASALIVVLFLLLPRGERGRLRASLWLLFLHLGAVALRALVPPHAEVQPALRAIAIFFLFACLGRSVFLLVVDIVLGRRMARPLAKIFRDILQVAVYVAVALLTLRALGVEPGSLLTTSALLTAVIGLSLQETLGNLFAGLSIQAQRPFDLGDWVQFDEDAECIGRVTEINWRATKVVTGDMVEVVVPNGTLAKAPIRNFTQPTRVSRRTAVVQGPYEVPPHRVEEALLEAIRGAAGILPSPPPTTILAAFADSGIEYWLYYYIDDFKRRHEIDSQVRVRIWYAFQRAGIGIPFPVRDVRTTDATLAGETERASRLDERFAALGQVDFLDVLPEPARRRLAAASALRLFAPGEDVIRQGAGGDELFIVLRGEATVLVDVEGHEKEVARLRPREFFGEMSLLTGEKRSATVRALTSCELLVVGHDAFQPLLAEAPDLAEHISRVLARRQAQLHQKAEASGSADVERVEDRKRVLLGRIRELFSL